MMSRSLIASSGSGVDEIVARFEATWIVEGEAHLARFLPDIGHRDRPSALIELIKVDMERRRMADRPRMLEDYFLEFPELQGMNLGEFGQAESDLGGGLAGLSSRNEARDWVGFDHDAWNGAGSDEPSGRGASTSGRAMFEATTSRKRVDLSKAARSYLDFRMDDDSGIGGGIESWAASNRIAGDAETVDVIVDLHRSDPEGAERLAEAVISLPNPGDTFLGFRLLYELGRGAFGRVYLASQGDLADRPVALKVSAEKPTESQTLAQLQHTNIVPIFSAHKLDTLHAVCMPYFGSTTLKDIYEELEDQPSMPTSGQGLLKTLASHRDAGSMSASASWKNRSLPGATVREASSPDSPEPTPDPQPLPSRSYDTLTLLGRLSYVDAILWIGARLADGLAHAHGRGILHRDLKPANILLTDSGQPMLLDFNLSEDTKKPASVASVGGTLPYMAPEHLKAFRGQDLAVDARSDIYALGIILYELLAGRHPFEGFSGVSLSILDRMIADRSKHPARLRERNPQVSPAVESIVRHCLEPDPSRRYQSAADLREDLERHMADLPLKHAPEPSTRERLAKWARRHPRLTSSTSVAILIGCVAFGVLAGFLVRAKKLVQLEAAEARATLLNESSNVRYLLNTHIFDRDRRTKAVEQGRAALSRYGTLINLAWTSKPLVTSLEADDRRTLLEDIGALLLFLAKAGQLDIQDLPPDDPARKAGAEAANRLCDLAGACFERDRAPRALLERRAELAKLLGRNDEAAKLMAEAARIPLRTALDHELAADALTTEGQFLKALPLALEATRLDPRDFWAWFTLGLCHERVGQDAEAAACFGTCIALRPDSPFGWFNRGVVYTRRGDYTQARRDLERASKLDPKWADPLSERAIAENLEGKPADAVRDYTRAFELGATDTRLYFLRAMAREKAGDAEGARLDREEGMKREPRDDLAYAVRALSRADAEPLKAVADLDRALKLNPRSLEALQDKAYVLSEKLGRIEEAEVVCDRAVTLYPDYVPSRSGRGVLRAILGRRDAALLDAKESLWRDTSPRILYQVAGIYAMTSKQVPEDKVEAYRLLSTALRKGFGFDELADDRELDPIRNDPEFLKLLEAAKAIREVVPEAAPRP